jgi:serine O-acetyltransferase
MFDNIRADLRAYEGDWSAQGFWVMVVYRFGRWHHDVPAAPLRKMFSLIYDALYKFVQILTGIKLPCEAAVGRNFIIDHFGGIIVSGYATFGDNCRIRNGVVVGLRRTGEQTAPIIGNNVDIGSGAKLLGPIRIGDNVLIGANAVVLCDVPDNCIAAGVPATVKPRRLKVLSGRLPTGTRSVANAEFGSQFKPEIGWETRSEGRAEARS